MKTTLAGLLAAAAQILTDTIQHGASLNDWKTWLPAVAIALIGYFAKDHSTDSSSSAPTTSANSTTSSTTTP